MKNSYVTAEITEGLTEWSRRLILDRETWERELASAPRVMVEVGDGDVLNCDVHVMTAEVSVSIMPGTARLGSCRVRLPRLNPFERAPSRSDPSDRAGVVAGCAMTAARVHFSTDGESMTDHKQEMLEGLLLELGLKEPGSTDKSRDRELAGRVVISDVADPQPGIPFVYEARVVGASANSMRVPTRLTEALATVLIRAGAKTDSDTLLRLLKL